MVPVDRVENILLTGASLHILNGTVYFLSRSALQAQCVEFTEAEPVTGNTGKLFSLRPPPLIPEHHGFAAWICYCE